MELFEEMIDPNHNWLLQDGIVNYYGKIFSSEEANMYLDRLLHDVEWRNDEAIIFGKKIVTKRKVAWYGDKAFEYTYSNTTKSALQWTEDLWILKTIVESITHETYNSCLLNLYHDGEEGMAWHSDGEKDLKKNAAIASLSFGAERKFAFKHKTIPQKLSLRLENGSLLVMKGTTQQYWLHRLPPTKLIKEPRINLTFRTIDQSQ